MPSKEHKKEGQQPKREYSDCNFEKLVDEALGLDKNKDNEKEMLERKIMKATERDILRLLHNGEFAKVSEFRYRMPHLRKWVEELEYRYWDDLDARMSQWK